MKLLCRGILIDRGINKNGSVRVSKVVRVRYENGALRLLEPVQLKEGD